MAKGKKRPYRKKKYPAEKKFVCPECGMKFYYMCKLKSHSLVHTGEKPYQCDLCPKSFNTPYSLKNHKYIHTDEKPFHCSFCKYSCRDSSTLRKHQYRHMGVVSEYRCKICDQTYEHRYKLKEHVAEVHLQIAPKKLPCELCGKGFKNRATLRSHVSTVHFREKECECPICHKWLTNISNLRAHMLTHVEEKPYACTYQGCGKRYKCTSSLAKHKILHTPEKQYPCEQCGRLFTRRDRLRRHKIVVHGKSKKVQCDYCGTRFLSKNYLIKHIKQKHDANRQKFICDECGLETNNKPSIVMHLKHGHGNENDRECTICHSIFKRHAYLKLHYARTHNVTYKTRKRPPPPVEIKQEPKDDSDVIEDKTGGLEFHYQIDKEEPPEVDSNPETEVQEQSSVTQPESEDLANKYDDVKSVPEDVFNKFYIDNYKRISFDEKVKGPRKKYRVDMRSREKALKSLNKILERVRQETTAATVEQARQMYNKRMKSFINREIKIKMFKNNKRLNASNNKEKTETSKNQTSQDAANSGEEEESNGEVEESGEERLKSNGKVKFNTHQCYVCYKLFQTKDELLNHCKDHFDLCFEKSLKKCPLCDYVCSSHLAKHLKREHDVKIRMPNTIYDKKQHDSGSKYYLKVNNPTIKQIEIIPSVKNLNKLASNRIDKRNREEKDRVIVKTKLVRKGKEWFVEKERVKLDDAIIPNFDKEALKKVKLGDSDAYFDSLKKLYHASKKSGKRMLFPCQHCEKICQNLAALKLHSRRHDPNAKPFKPKVWKHKLKGNEKNVKEQVKRDSVSLNRTAKPKPIKNNHKCDYELQEFYNNNIRGGDIEFWQFLKIFNKMDRDNINDFKDLKGNYEYGMGHHLSDFNGDEIAENDNITGEGSENPGKRNKSTGEVSSNTGRSAKKLKSVSEPNNTKAATSNNIEIADKSADKLSNKITRRQISDQNSHTKVFNKSKVPKRIFGMSKTAYVRRMLAKEKLREKIRMDSEQCN